MANIREVVKDMIDSMSEDKLKKVFDILESTIEQKRNHLEKSADLYAEIYSEDSKANELTESAISGWPE